MTLGPAYWQSLRQLQGTARFVLDLNFAKNDTDYIRNLRAYVNETFNSVREEDIHLWEIGNEDDGVNERRKARVQSSFRTI